jgi:dTDP-4-dehydrorhamnose 3,5-epimerase
MRQRRRVGPRAVYRSPASVRRTPSFARADGFLPGARKDGQSVRPDWLPAQKTIDGVRIREVRNVQKGHGLLTEVFRADWRLDDGVIAQVFQVALGPGEISAWHAHRRTLDRLFANRGAVRIVLYDARTSSPTHGQVNEFRFGEHRPALLIVPPGIWHGVENLRGEPSALLNLVDHAYSYEDPDHWRLPVDSPRIPFSFGEGVPSD